MVRQPGGPGRRKRHAWVVDEILQKKVRHGVAKYQCTWEGHDEDHKTWEPKKNLPAGLVAEFERALKEAVRRDAASRAAVKEKMPYVIHETVGTDAEARRKYAPVTIWKDEVVRQVLGALGGLKGSKVVTFPRVMCAPWAFVDLHRMLYELAASLQLGVATENLVTKITSERGALGGKYVVDSFFITSYDVLHLLMGQAGRAALAMRANGTALMLLPPLKISFKTTRVAGAKQSLQLWAHFGALVWGSRVFDFIDDLAEPANDREREELELKKLNHKRGIKAAVNCLAAETDGVVPEGMLQWLAVLP